MALTHEQVLKWRQYIINEGHTGNLDALTDSIKSEIEDGFFRIEKGQIIYQHQSADYRALYDAFDKFLLGDN